MLRETLAGDLACFRVHHFAPSETFPRAVTSVNFGEAFGELAGHSPYIHSPMI
jgi:hypothetical protein